MSSGRDQETMMGLIWSFLFFFKGFKESVLGRNMNIEGWRNKGLEGCKQGLGQPWGIRADVWEGQLKLSMNEKIPERNQLFCMIIKM